MKTPFPPAGTVVALLTREHRRKQFRSGDARVDAWLIHKALGSMAKNTSTTRVLARTDGMVVGYYTLANTALDVSLVPPALFGGVVPTRAPPTLTLAWLGVDEKFKGAGIGTRLFARALADGVRIYHLVRFVAVIIDVLTPASFTFYESKGFLPVPGAASKLYLPAATLMRVALESAAEAPGDDVK